MQKAQLHAERFMWLYNTTVHIVLSFMKVMKVFGKGPESLNHLLSQQGGMVSIMDMVFLNCPVGPLHMVTNLVLIKHQHDAGVLAWLFFSPYLTLLNEKTAAL